VTRVVFQVTEDLQIETSELCYQILLSYGYAMDLLSNTSYEIVPHRNRSA